ncbi:MAG: glyoxylate reductase [Acidimicrobiaceae bacterium]|nr:glyoxylate reductase [Acidimicrobiaceae bacterium]
MSRPRIFVVQPIPAEVVAFMGEHADVEVYPYTDRQLSVDALAAAARRNDYLFTMHETFVPRQVIEANRDLRGVVAWSWGGDDEYEEFIDVAACEEFGVRLLFHPEATHQIAREANAKATADLTLAMLMCLAFRVPEAERALGVTWVEKLDDLVADVDFVCMMANYHPAASKLMGATQFASMKPSAYFINSARGRLVDEQALIDALQRESIAGAGLDVYWNEPPVSRDPFVPLALRRMPNVVLQPHNGGATWVSRLPETMAVAEAIVNDIKGYRG